MKLVTLLFFIFLPSLGFYQLGQSSLLPPSDYNLAVNLVKQRTGLLEVDIELAKRENDLSVKVFLTNESARTKHVCPISERSVYVQVTPSESGEWQNIPAGSRPFYRNLKASELVRLIPGNSVSGTLIVSGYYEKQRDAQKLRVLVFANCDGVSVDASSEFKEIPK